MVDEPQPVISDEQLYELLKSDPRFECLPLPKSWYEKFNLKLKQPLNYKESIESNYSMKVQFEQDTLPPETIQTPADYVFTECKPDEVPLEIISKEITSKEITSNDTKLIEVS